MATFKTKARLIDAEQFFRDKPLPFAKRGPYVQFGCPCGENAACSLCGKFWVTTAHGQHVTLEDGDWVVPEPSGPHVLAFAAYPVKPDIFAATYEEVGALPLPQEASDPIVGHKTFHDGHHEPLRQSEAAALIAATDEAKARRAQQMPDERSAILALFEAWLRLKELGWKEAQYCPKDGSLFDAIEAGSTGIHRCRYDGKWPDGHWWIVGDDDLYPSRPILFRSADRASVSQGPQTGERLGANGCQLGTTAPKLGTSEGPQEAPEPLDRKEP